MVRDASRTSRNIISRCNNKPKSANTMLFRKHNCERDGHRMEARYDTTPVLDEDVITAVLDGISMYDAGSAIASMQKRTYVCDICPYCGFTVKR